MNGMKACDSFTIEHFLAAIITGRFDDDMKKEWANHHAGKDTFLKVQELLTFFKR